jgi:hypothetical protein
MCFFFFFFFVLGQKKPSTKRLGRKTKVSPPLPKRVDTSQKDAQKITHPDDDDDDDGVRGVL